ncbi:MAG: OmpA family protein [Gammaproteobacteria bacterium]|nr:OmpA family protein [Gammaproteobacteria bacterium]
MDFRFSQFEILTGAGALFLCLFFVAVFSEASAIEEELGSAVKAAVGKKHLFWASVEPHGQTIVLTGAAPDYYAKQQAGAIAASVNGVTAVDNQIAIIGEAGTCQKQLDGYLASEEVTFKKGRADLSESSFALLTMLASLVRNCDTRLEIAAHTDAMGDARVNLKLSQRRAAAVVKYLVQRGVDPQRLDAKGYGESQPVADNESEAGRSKNRRVEFRVIGETT